MICKFIGYRGIYILRFFFLAMPLWLVKSQLPDQGLNPGHDSETANHWTNREFLEGPFL